MIVPKATASPNLRIGCGSWSYCIELSDESYANGDYEEALAHATRAINFKPALWVGYDQRGLIHLKLKNYLPAIEDFTEAINKGKDFVPAKTFNYRGVAFSYIDLLDYALEDFEKAVKKAVKNDSDSAIYKENRDSVAQQLGVSITQPDTNTQPDTKHNLPSNWKERALRDSGFYNERDDITKDIHSLSPEEVQSLREHRLHVEGISNYKANETDQCDDAYSGACIPYTGFDLDCDDISARNFYVLPGRDRHNFDGNNDGRGCEGY